LARWGAPVAIGTISATGGTLSGADGISLTFPAGALPDGALFGYSPQFLPAYPAPSGQVILRSFQLLAVDADGNLITTFAQPYTLRVPYTAAQLAALGVSDPTKLNVAYWNGTAWKAMLPCAGCKVDTVGKAVVVVANHFTEFALVAPNRSYVYLPMITR
jgi:hypothetical protein